MAVALFGDRRSGLDLRPLVVSQVFVLGSTVVAGSTSPNAYAEWSAMVAVILGYALASWRGAGPARPLAMASAGATTIAVALILLRAFSSITLLAIGLVFASGALLAALLRPSARVRA